MANVKFNAFWHNSAEMLIVRRSTKYFDELSFTFVFFIFFFILSPYFSGHAFVKTRRRTNVKMYMDHP